MQLHLTYFRLLNEYKKIAPSFNLFFGRKKNYENNNLKDKISEIDVIKNGIRSLCKIAKKNKCLTFDDNKYFFANIFSYNTLDSKSLKNILQNAHETNCTYFSENWQ